MTITRKYMVITKHIRLENPVVRILICNEWKWLGIYVITVDI